MSTLYKCWCLPKGKLRSRGEGDEGSHMDSGPTQ